jgi:hypothetical protein
VVIESAGPVFPGMEWIQREASDIRSVVKLEG